MNMNHPVPEDRYLLAFELKHDELIPFVRQNLRRINIISVSYYLVNLAILAWIIAEIVVKSDNDAKMSVLSSVLLGFAPTILFVPLHEFLHGVAYKMAGAGEVSYAANWRKFYFTAQADRFVVGVKAFYGIAFAPIIIISSCILLAMVFVGPTFYYVLLGVLFVHTSMCSGDFAIASYMYSGRKSDMLTYDDVPNKTSYFFILSSSK